MVKLTKRDDLDRGYVRTIVRRGLDEMPSFRITEISEVVIRDDAVGCKITFDWTMYHIVFSTGSF